MTLNNVIGFLVSKGYALHSTAVSCDGVFYTFVLSLSKKGDEKENGEEGKGEEDLSQVRKLMELLEQI